MSVKRELIGIHKARFPTELFRCQATRSVKLRDYALQKNKAQFDLVLHAGLVVPQPAGSTVFRGPNGMSLRPGGNNYGEILGYTAGKKVFVIPEGCPMPDKLQLLHEDSDRYALQTTEPCSLPELEARMTAFMAKLKWITKDEYFRLFPLGS